MKPHRAAFACLLLLLAPPVLADGPEDNIPENVRRIPPPGAAIADDARAGLTAQAAELRRKIDETAGAWRQQKNDPTAARQLRYLPDVEIFWKAADWALRYDEFYDAKQADWARGQLTEGTQRLESLAKNELPWLAQTGLVVRGYRSKIDDSVQPFGLVVPESFNPQYPHRWRLDAWFHGRGEKLTELAFIHDRQHNPGEFTPQDTIVLHPYGRYCNGSRFAGETDFFEALEAVQRDYRIDEDRLVVRGFSLGGAACWHIAAHHAWRWCAAAPGAGFSETEEFLNFFQGEKLQPHWWERKLWNLYDATAVAANFFNLPVVAYSGEIDKQKQAADLMAKALEKEGLTLTHIIGPQTAHKYEPGAKAEVNRRIDALARSTKPDLGVDAFMTYSLRQNRLQYASIDALDEHWKEARIAVLRHGTGVYQVNLDNINAFTLDLPPGTASGFPRINFGKTVSTPFPNDPKITITEFPAGNEPDSFELPLHKETSDGSFRASFHKERGKWVLGPLPKDGLRKKHGLQGPIDDAFMECFLFVRPTRAAANEKAGSWAKAELERAIEQWRRQFRGDARVKDDTAITEEDMKDSHLVLWGDPSSNAVLAKIAAHLPIQWTAGEIKAGEKSFPAANHALAAIYPNPLNPEKYVVLNSGFTFREYDALNNARQTPKLPDWAIFDLDTPPGTRFAGKVVAADFFGERWELKPHGKE